MMPGTRNAWTFEKIGPMGGAAGYSRVMAGSIAQPDLLAREAIQNSVDAALRLGEGRRAKVVFRFLCLVGTTKRRFVDAAALRDFAERSSDLKGLASGHCLSNLDTPGEPLRLLAIEDAGTPGLDGDHRDPESAWFRFLLSLGDSGKTDEAVGHSGGSYGFGKTALSSASRLTAIFAYTRFRMDDGERTRLMGCAYLDAFRSGKDRQTGRAWLGRQASDGSGLVEPFRDSEADDLAKDLAIGMRACGQRGTTVLIVDPVDEMTSEGILRAVETWWWPRLCDDEVEVAVVGEDGLERRPAPRKRLDLTPYIRCWTLATVADAQPEKGREIRRSFNRVEGVALGNVALRAEPPGDGSEDDEGEAINAVPTDRVALIRFPKMVVSYQDPGGRASAPIVGVFRADGEADDILRMAEPPEHDRWEATNRRLPDERAKRVVKAIHDRIKKTVRDFRREMRPPPPSGPALADDLSRMLGDLFAPGVPSRSGPGHESSPVSIRYDQEPMLEPESSGGGMVVLRAKVRIALADDQVQSLPIRVSFSCPILEEEKEGEDEVPLTVKAEADSEADEENANAFRGILRKGRPWRFDILSAPYEAEWSVRLMPQVEAFASR